MWAAVMVGKVAEATATISRTVEAAALADILVLVALVPGEHKLTLQAVLVVAQGVAARTLIVVAQVAAVVVLTFWAKDLMAQAEQTIPQQTLALKAGVAAAAGATGYQKITIVQT
jgi:hypothetical protein